MIKLENLLREEVLKEEFRVALKGRKFALKLVPNVNPTKQGIKIQFIELGSSSELPSIDKKNIEASLQNFLNKAFAPFRISVNSDPDVPNEKGNVIGFYIPLEQIEGFVKKALKGIIEKNKSDEKSTDDEKETDSNKK